MLMDWSGGVVDSFGLKDVDREAVAVVLDSDQKIIGSATGEQIGDGSSPCSRRTDRPLRRDPLRGFNDRAICIDAGDQSRACAA